MIRWGASVSVLLVTSIAAVISYGHAYELVRRYGESGNTARALPLTVDGLIATCSLVLLDSARRGRRAPWHAWGLLGAGVVATVGANVAHGLNHSPVGAVVAGWPALVAVGSFELLVRLVRDAGPASHRPADDHDQAPAEVTETDHSTAPRQGTPGAILDHPAEVPADLVGPGRGPALDLASAVRSASLTGMSKRSLAEAFGITRYQVDKILDQPPDETEPASTGNARPLAVVNGRADL
jgi:hypothetical protein